MRPVRIYLLLYSNKSEWTSSVHRDLDEVFGILEAARQGAETVGIVHVGISRPPNSAFAQVVSAITDCVILTTSARWVFDDVGTYSDAIDHVDGYGIHVALSGWGHANPDLINIALPHQSANEDELIVYGSQWLTYFDHLNPKIARQAWSLGVHDDTSYHAHEQYLDWDMRHALGIARMEYLMRTRDSDNPIQVATCSPPWLIDTPLDLINATVRCSRALKSASIVFVADLLHLTMDDLLKIPHFGRKSLKDLAMALRAAVQSGPILKTIGKETYKKVARPGGEVRFVIEHKDEPRVHSDDKPPSWRSFKLALESSKARLKKSQAIVLGRRIGSAMERMTLAEVGEAIGTTRERVRQIEAAAIETIQADGVWQTELATRLDSILTDREDPLPAQSLGIFDPWFADVENLLPEFEFILERVLDNRFFVLEINGCRFVTRISKGEWHNAVREASMVLEHGAQDKISKSDARRSVEELLSSKGSELASELWASVQPIALFAKNENGIEQVVGVGTSAESLVAAVLAASDRPLHFTELPTRIQDAFGRSIEVRRAHSAASSVGLLFGRGTFGTLRHCPLTPEEMDVLREEAEEIVLSGPNGRQWSCFELAETLGERGLDFEDRINQYVVHIALKRSSVLSSLGRFVWTQSGERPSGTQDRIDISQAILSVLQSTGRPMTKIEIRAALLRDRGLSGNFQINTRGSLVRTAAGCWGILERDIPLSPGELRNARNAAAILLEGDQCGMHLTEIRERLRNVAPEILRIEDPYAILSILLGDQRFKTSMSGYMYLASWEGPRRLSQGEAVVAVLRRMKEHGIKASELAKQAAEILGRPVEKESVYAAMVANGAIFDEETGRWSLREEDESEADLNEDAGAYPSLG